MNDAICNPVWMVKYDILVSSMYDVVCYPV